MLRVLLTSSGQSQDQTARRVEAHTTGWRSQLPTPTTRKRLQDVIHMARSAGVIDPVDRARQSSALQPYLAKQEKSLKAKLAKQLGL